VHSQSVAAHYKL